MGKAVKTLGKNNEELSEVIDMVQKVKCKCHLCMDDQSEHRCVSSENATKMAAKMHGLLVNKMALEG